jgi:anti-anti-sigma factor
VLSGAMAELWLATPVRYCTRQFSQRHSRMLVIDLARVDRIDAGGLGVLLGLRESARSSAIMFKLMNVTKRVEGILALTHLQRVFEFCSVREFFCLLHRAASMPSCSADQSNRADEDDSRKEAGEWCVCAPTYADRFYSRSSPEG